MELDEWSDNICSGINVKSYDLQNKDKKALNTDFIIICLCVVTPVILCFLKHRKWKRQNRNARILFIICSISSVINIILAVLQTDALFTGYYVVDDYSKTVLWGCLVSLILGSFIMPTYLLNKSYEPYNYDYILPKLIRKYLNKRLDNTVEIKSTVVIIGYPFLLLGLIPFGIVTFAYTIPVVFISFLCIEIRRIYRWINEKNGIKDLTETENETCVFKDYYLILNINENSDQNEINKAFNDAMARYNSGIDKKIFGSSYELDLLEAYRVLSSTARLKPEYDEEYRKYKISQESEYKYSDTLLIKDIKTIRKTLLDNSKKRSKNIISKKQTKGNPIVVSLIVFLILIFLIIAVR